jgi:hypothetical protein
MQRQISKEETGLPQNINILTLLHKFHNPLYDATLLGNAQYKPFFFPRTDIRTYDTVQ